MKSLPIIISAAALCLLASCNEPQTAGAVEGGGGPPPTQVTTQLAKQQDVPVSFEYVGQVAGSYEVEVRSRITGIIEKRLYEEGEKVSEKDVLFRIDDAPFKAEHAQAEAALASAKASKSSAVAQLKKAERDLARVAPLTKKQLLSQSQTDDAESGVEIAKAALLQSDAAILQAKANVQTAKINLNYTTIKAPISGIAGRALKKEGSLTQAGTDSLLTSISRVDPVYVNFGIAESEQLQRQQDITNKTLILPESGFRVALQTTNGRTLEQTGELNFKDYKVDPSTGNFSMRATVANPNQELAPGQFIRVLLQGAKRPAAILVPQRAVLDNPQGKYVYVVGKGENDISIAEQRPVEVGEWAALDGEKKNTWIIKSGLNEGDEVVVEGMARIFFPGMPIQPAPAEKPAETADASDSAAGEPATENKQQ